MVRGQKWIGWPLPPWNFFLTAGASYFERRQGWRIYALEPSAEEGIPAADVMLEIGQGPVTGHRFYPEGNAGKLDGCRVEVYTEEASFSDPAFRPGAGFRIGGPSLLVGRLPVLIPALPGCASEVARRSTVSFLNIGLMESLAEKAHGLNKKMSASAGRVEDAELLDFGRRSVFDEGSQGVSHQVADKSTGRVK